MTGNPGSTSRLDTVAHLEQLRDTSIPIILRLLERREAMLKKYMAMGEEQTRQAQNELNSVQNSLKVYRGQLKGLKDPALMARKKKEEQALRKSIAGESGTAEDVRRRVGRDRQSTPDLSELHRDRRIFEQPAVSIQHLFNFARTLVRLAAEKRRNQMPSVCRSTLMLVALHWSSGSIRRLRFTKTSRS